MIGSGRAVGVSLLVLVVDDEPAMVGAISALVGRAGHRVVTAYDGHTALRRFEEERPDLVLLDLAMPGLDGVEVCRAIRRTAQTPIIVLTGESDERAKVEALDTGADDYVVKPFGKQELLARIRAVMRRHGPEVEPRGIGELRWGSIVLDRGRHTASVADASLVLTRTEYSLLAALVSAGGRVVSHSALLSAGWPGEPNPDAQWLKPHLARLRSKLAEAGAPVPASVRGVGYRLEDVV
jgi:DNA-binding response OmpR family regulator